MNSNTKIANWRRWMLPFVLVLMVAFVVAYTCNVNQGRSSGHRWATVVYCVGTPSVPVGCFPYPIEWGAYFVVKGHIHGNDNNPINDYRYNIHYGEQVMWWDGVLDNSGNYFLPFGLLYGMSNEVHSYSYGDLGNIPVGDPCPPMLIPGDFTTFGCYDSSVNNTIELGKPGGYGEFHAGWAATGLVIPPSGDTVDYPWFLYHVN
jgi:hypothetical protein